MNYWLFITTRENWVITRKKKILGVAERHRNALSRVQKGDKCVIYIKRAERVPLFLSAVSGGYELISDVYYDNRRIFNMDSATVEETYPLRLKLKLVTPSEKPIEFKPLVPKLSDFFWLSSSLLLEEDTTTRKASAPLCTV
jgi:predicted RNA-binding protein